MAYKKKQVHRAKNESFLARWSDRKSKILRSEPLDDEEISNAPTKEEIEEEGEGKLPESLQKQ